MNDPGAAPSPTPRWKRGTRLRMLLGGLIALLMAHAVLGLDPGLVGGGGCAGRPLDRCITEQAVREFLDGKTVVSIASVDAPGLQTETIMLRKDKISSLRIRADDDYAAILVQFNLDHQGKRYRVQGDFQFTTSDAPSLHSHSWDHFKGWVVSRR